MSIPRRCLLCGNINPCAQHSGSQQESELDRNMREIRRIEQKGDMRLRQIRAPQ